MKKILSNLASLVLITGSVASATAWTQQKQQATPKQAQAPTTNETAQDIANKLNNKTVTLYLNQWYNKTVNENLPLLRNDLVTQSILTKNEAQYVTGTMSEGKFTKQITIINEVFIVTKDGQTADAKGISLAVRDSATAKSIANSLSNKTVNLDGSFWEGKKPYDYQTAFTNALVQDGLIKPYQKKDIVVFYDQTFSPLKSGQEYKNYSLAVNKDGLNALAKGITLKVSIANEAQYIADKISGKTIKLDLSQWYDKTLNNNLPMLRNDLVTQGILTKDEAQYVTGTMSEGKFTKPITITNEIFHITKDGKTADAKGISLAVKDNESGQALATHLSNKTINLDGSFWEGKTPRKYLADFQDALVQDGLIKPYQKQYIVLYDDPFPPLKQGQEYKNFRFLVHKNGDYEEVNGTTLKVSIANEAQYIVDKLNNKTINLDLNQWYDKSINANLALLREALVKQNILTQAEAQDVSNGSLLSAIKNPGKIANNLFYVVAGQQVAIAHNITFNVYDSATAKSIANNLTNKTVNLDGSFWNGKRLYDNQAAFANALVQDGLIKPYQKQDITVFYNPSFPTLQKGQEYKNYSFAVEKNGLNALVEGVTLKVS